MTYYFQLMYYVYSIVILGIPLTLAIRTRKVKIEVLNDYKWVSAIVYIGVPIVVVFQFVVTSVLQPWIQLNAAIFCIELFVFSSLILCLSFIPKVR